MPVYDYRIALNHNVALGSLTNVETLLTLAPKSGLVDLFPVRRGALSGKVYGEGMLTVDWTFTRLPVTYFKVIEDTFHTNGTVVSAAVTIYTRLANRAEYRRYNAYSILPQPGVAYEYENTMVMDLVWTFNKLVQI